VTSLEQDYFYNFKIKSSSFVMQKNDVVMVGGFWQKIVKKCEEKSHYDWLTTTGSIFSS